MKLLALDTSAEACSAALNLDGEILGRFEHAPRRHTELILPMIEALLADAGLALKAMDGLAFGRGPGSFTGVRIAAGVAQGIALGADLPVMPVSTLAALAQRCYLERGRREILTAFDARMGEVYWAIYRIDERGLASLIDNEAVVPPDEVGLPGGGDWFGVGSGWSQYSEALAQRSGLSEQDIDPQLVCRAEEIAILAMPDLLLGNGLDPEKALPVYLRDKVAWRKQRSP